MLSDPLRVTLVLFGNCPANGLVTEHLQESSLSCFLLIWQNIEKRLIYNRLRFVFFSFPLLVLLLYFHCARHSFGTLTLEAGIPIESIAKMMGHSSIASTQIYAQITDQKIARDMERAMSI